MGNICSCTCCTCCSCCNCCQTLDQPEIQTSIEQDRLQAYLKFQSRPPQSKGMGYISEETLQNENQSNFDLVQDQAAKRIQSIPVKCKNPSSVSGNYEYTEENLNNLETSPQILETEGINHENNESFEVNLNNLELIQEETKNLDFEESSKCSQELCKDSHCFVWRQDLVFRFMSRKEISSGPVVMKCVECCKRFSRPGFECSVCKAVKCERCGLVEGLQKPALVCSRNDPLVWSVDSWAFSIEFNGATRQAFVCSACRKTYQEPAFTCHKCFYYLCIGCSGKKGVCPPMNLLKCPDNESLFLNPSPNSFYHCSQCEKHTKEPGYFCNSCTYSLCKSCSSKLCLSMLRHPGLYCKSNHTSMTLSQVKSVKNSGHPNCLSCGKSNMTYVLSCSCGQRLCLECADSLQTIIEECIGKELAKKQWVKWYKLIDLYIGETKICNKCEGEITHGVYFYDNTNYDTCYCYDCIAMTSD